MKQAFKDRRIVPEKLGQTGFLKSKDDSGRTVYRLKRKLMDGAFDAVVELYIMDDTENFNVISKVFDAETGEEYLPVSIESYQGKYVGAVREELRLLLEDIAASCTTDTAVRPPAWIIPANPKHYDIEKGFAGSPDRTLTWTQRVKARAGDTLFIYHTEPVASLTFRCTIVEADIPADPAVGDGFTRGKLLMRIKAEEQYPAGKYPRSFLNEHGIKKTVRGQRSCPGDLYHAVMDE